MAGKKEWTDFDKLSYKKKTQVLEMALDIMEAYNGRGKEACIDIATKEFMNSNKKQ